jgi:hypothetical protein
MKKYASLKSVAFALIGVIIFWACQKNNPQPTTPTNNQAGDSISVSSFSPAQPYTDDTFVITGMNFNADPAKDTVYYGTLTKPNFSVSNTCTVTAASATQLTVTINYDPNKNQNPDYILTSPLTSGFDKGFMIKANGKTKVIAVPFKILPVLSASSLGRYTPSSRQYGFANCAYGSPTFFYYEGDSISFDLIGCCSPFTITLNDKPLNWKFTSKAGTTHASAMIPFGFFGEADPDPINNCPTFTSPNARYVKIKITNTDGKVKTWPGASYQTPPQYFPSPNTQVVSASLNAISFSKSNSGTQPLFKVTGYALRSNMQVRIAAMRNGVQLYNQVVGIIPAGYPNEFTQALDLSGLPDPPLGGSDNYVVSLFTDGSPNVTLWAAAGFTFTP